MFDFVIGNDNFGKNLSNALGCGYREFRDELYADNEPCPRIMANYDELKGRRIVLAPRTAQKPTRDGPALYLHNCARVLGSLTDEELYGAGRVELVLPYFMLGRQDHNPRTDVNERIRTNDRGKDVGYKSMLKVFSALGAKRIFTFDPHFYRKEGTMTEEGVEIVSLSGVYALGRYFDGNVSSNTVVVGPDANASVLSSKLAAILGMKSHDLVKRRINDTEVETRDVYDADGSHVIIVDDILSTGGTVRNAIDKLHNAASVRLAFVHPVLPDVGYNRITQMRRSGSVTDIVATDTINSDFSNASVIPELAEALRRLDAND